MKLTWKWTSVNLLLLAMTGCLGVEQKVEVPETTTKVSPVASPALKSEVTKDAPKADSAKSTDDGPKVEGPKAENARPSAVAAPLTAKQLAAIHLLPESEQALAVKQAVCPVGGGPLGAMGKPFKMTIDGRTFYLCCDGCVDEAKADPKAIIAKLDQHDDQK